jgi:tRNA(His) 5'-end guanylyltransferase
MKSYEDGTRLPKGAVIIRVDGKGFHKWTRKANLERPFDSHFHSAMGWAMHNTIDEMQGCTLAYTQSDECTFLLTNFGERESGWFDYKIQKISSVTASVFTYYFNQYWKTTDKPPAFFDSRAYSTPIQDAANSFVWRQQDNDRNWVQAWAHSLFPQKDVVGKSNSVLLCELEFAGHKVSDVPDWVKYGTFISNGRIFSEPKNYQEINLLAGIKEESDAPNKG